jgi:hypothetical protein
MVDKYDYTSALLESIEAMLGPDTASEATDPLNEDSYTTFD